MTIEKHGNKYRVVSEHTGRNLGESDTKAGAVRRLKQIEYFKNLKKHFHYPEELEKRTGL